MFALVLAFAGLMFWAASETMLQGATALGQYQTKVHDSVR
jgi:hypothetical protein